MPATELTCDSDIELVRALRSVGVLSGLGEDDPGDALGPQQTAPASRRDTPDVRHAAFTPPRDTPAARSGRRPAAADQARAGGSRDGGRAAGDDGLTAPGRRGAGDEQRAVPARGPG